MDHRLRLDWTVRNINALNDAFRAFLADSPYTVATDLDAKGENYISRFRINKPTPAGWSLMVGDIVHNLRSSLDNLAFALAMKNSGAGLTRKQIASIQFPICDTSDAFTGSARQIESMSTATQAAIESLQPYNAPNLTPHPLAIVRELSNIDKHRYILLSRLIAKPITLYITWPDRPDWTPITGMFEGPVEDGTICCSFPRSIGDVLHPDVHVQATFPVDISFADTPPVPHASVRPVLISARDHIADVVLPALEPFL